MAFEVFNDSEQGTNFVVGVVAMPICILATIFRLVATRRSRRKIGLEDTFAVLALLTFLVFCSLDLANIVLLNGGGLVALFTGPTWKLNQAYRVGYGMNIQNPLNQTFAKLSLLALYHRIFYVSDAFRYWLWPICAFQVSWCIAMVLVRFFECTPIEAAYTPLLSLKPGNHCINSQILLAAGDSINAFIDFVMIGLAIWIVNGLRQPTSVKLKLGFLFALGGFSGVIGLIRIADSYGSVGSSVRDATWIMAQESTSIICCCAPIYKSLLGKFSFSATLSKLGSSIFSFRKSRGASDDGDSNSGREYKSRGENVDWLRRDELNQPQLAAWSDVESASAGGHRSDPYASKTAHVETHEDRV